MSFWFEDTNGKWLDDFTGDAVRNLTRLSPPKSKTRHFLDLGSGKQGADRTCGFRARRTQTAASPVQAASCPEQRCSPDLC